MGARKIKTKKDSKKKVMQQLKGAVGAFKAISEVQLNPKVILGDAPTLSGSCGIAFDEVVRLKGSEEDDNAQQPQSLASED